MKTSLKIELLGVRDMVVAIGPSPGCRSACDNNITGMLVDDSSSGNRNFLSELQNYPSLCPASWPIVDWREVSTRSAV